jgi:hypothetical protein
MAELAQIEGRAKHMAQNGPGKQRHSTHSRKRGKDRTAEGCKYGLHAGRSW